MCHKLTLLGAVFLPIVEVYWVMVTEPTVNAQRDTRSSVEFGLEKDRVLGTFEVLRDEGMHRLRKFSDGSGWGL